MRAGFVAILFLFVFLLAPQASFPAGSGEPYRIVGRDPLPDVPVARSQREARELLAKELPGAGGRLLLVSPHDYLATLILPLRREGALKELAVVLPFDNVLGEEHLEQVRTFQEQAGVPEEDRKTLRLSGGSIGGAIGGMPFALYTLAGLPRQEGREFLLALDTSFLSAVYRNEVKTPMVDLAWKLVLTLRDRRVFANRAVLFDAVGRADFPLEQGYLMILAREMLSDPGRFSDTLPEKWRMLKAAESAYFFAQYADGMALYRRYLEAAPGDASACYKIAMMAIRDLDVDMSLQWVNKAVEADPLYKRAYSEIGGYLFRKDLLDAAERVLLAGLNRFPKDPLLATNLAALYLSRGEALREAGETGAAAEFFALAADVEGADPPMRERAKTMADSLSGVLPK